MALSLASFIFGVLVVRKLGGDSFGQLSIVMAWAGIFSVLGDLGITQYFTREIARNKESVSAYFWDVVGWRFVLAFFAAFVTISGAILQGYSSEIVLAVAVYTSSYLFAAIQVPLSSIISGSERLGYLSFLSVLGQIIYLTVAALFLVAGLDFIWLVGATIANFPVLIALSIRYIVRNHLSPPAFHLHFAQWKRLLFAGLPFAFIQLALSLSFRLDTVMLSGHVPDQEVGWYSAAYSLTLSFMVLTRSFNTAILPTLAREHATDPTKIYPWYYRSVKFLALLGLPIAIGGMLRSDQIIGLLFGAENAPVAPIFAVIIWDLPLVMYTSFCGNLASSVKRERSASRIYGSIAALNLVLNLVLIPHFGVIGSAFATVLTDATAAALFYALFRREFGAGLGLKYMMRLAVAAALTGVVINVLFVSNLLLIGVVSFVTYLALIWGLRVLTVEERAMFDRLVQRFRFR